MFITFEGGEGVGKSTQIRRIARWFEARNRKVVLTREPGGTPGAECARHVLLSGRAEPLGAEMEAVLFAAARRDNVEQIILPALRTGAVVISDRYLDSSRVYQSVVGGVDPIFLSHLEAAAVEGAWPDLTLILDMPPETGMERLRRRQEERSDDRFEREDLATHVKRREGFLAVARAAPERCRVIDADRTVEEVAAAVIEAVQNLEDTDPT